MSPLRGAFGAFSRVFALLTLCCGAPAHAAEPEPVAPEACIEGYENSQEFRNDHRLIEASVALSACIKPGCPQALQRQCSRWLEDVERAQPSVVLQATVNGEDARQIDVELDGLPLSQSLDGKSIAVDPGPHTFLFRFRDEAPISKHVVVREGEKLRAVSVAFDTHAVAATRKPGPASSATESESARPIPMAAYVLAGVAVASATVATYFALSGRSEEHRLERECAPNCASSRVDVASRRYTIANVAAGISGAALIGGAVLYLLQQTPARKDRSIRVELGASRNWAGGFFSVSF